MTAMIVSSVIFVVALTLIFTEKMNRSITGIAGAAVNGSGRNSAGVLLTRRSCCSH